MTREERIEYEEEQFRGTEKRQEDYRSEGLVRISGEFRDQWYNPAIGEYTDKEKGEVGNGN